MAQINRAVINTPVNNLLEQSGYLYVLSHPSDKDLFKIGITRRDPKIRLQEHNTQLDKAAGKVVAETGQHWILKEAVKVADVYLAENVFWQRTPVADIPHLRETELVKIAGTGGFDYQWILDGLEEAKKAKARSDTSIAPIPKTTPNRGAEWIASQLVGSGIRPMKTVGNGTTKVWFVCSKDHQFKMSGYTLVGGYKQSRQPSCPVCSPERYNSWEHQNHIELGSPLKRST